MLTQPECRYPSSRSQPKGGILACAALAAALFTAFPATLMAQPVPPWLVFTGPDPGWVEVPDAPALDPTSAITIEAWVYLLDTSGYGSTGNCPTLVGKDYTRSYWLGLVCGTSQLRFYTHGDTTGVDSTGSVPIGAWTHVAVTYDGSTTTFYIDGLLDSSTTAAAAPIGVSTAPLRIGNDVSWNESPRGEIGQVRLWNITRAQCDIVSTINKVITTPMPGLVAAWNLQGNGNDALGVYNGTLMNDVSFLSIPTPICQNHYFIPTSGHLAGEAGTQWVTDMSTLNLGSAVNNMRIALLPRDQDNSHPTAIYQFNALSPGQAMSFPDIIQTAFGQTNMAAALAVCSDQPLLVSSRTYNVGAAGTYGQGVPGFPAAESIKPGQYAYLTFLYENARYRTNVGFVNSSFAPITVTVDFYLAGGTHIGTQTYNLPPHGYIQRGHIFHEVTGNDISNGTLRISTSCGGLFAYASVIDNSTGDPTYFEAQ